MASFIVSHVKEFMQLCRRFCQNVRGFLAGYLLVLADVHIVINSSEFFRLTIRWLSSIFWGSCRLCIPCQITVDLGVENRLLAPCRSCFCLEFFISTFLASSPSFQLCLPKPSTDHRCFWGVSLCSGYSTEHTEMFGLGLRR